MQGRLSSNQKSVFEESIIDNPEAFQEELERVREMSSVQKLFVLTN